MTYEEFIEKIEEILGFAPCKFDPEDSYTRGAGDLAVWIKWSTGGVHGASCWDDSPANIYTEGEPEPEFDELDKILEAISPNITFMQYRNLSREVVKSNSSSDGDYYGNTSHYATKHVLLKDLYKALNDRGIL